MDKDKSSTERTTRDDRKRHDEALANPHKFFPRPEDVLRDDSLSADEKRSLLDNWRVQLEGRGGAMEPGNQTTDAQDGDKDLKAAVTEALARIESDKSA